ncbi:complement factor B-like [Acanthaster planci]|uniref:C3/C5 convertase n=1 Tax=Acanthaster planci TaxID=133434 RepID=A0A8B7ZZD4_ACAPL|nr:complement factor B-like [Acanthaster planci]
MDYSVAKTVISFTVLLTAASCSEVICPSILESEADIEHLQSNMENRNYRLGEVVDYHCDAGYRILGKTWRECSGPSLDFPNQTWSDLDPICSEVECPDPGDIQFEAGRYLESTNVGGSVRFSCRSGYSLRGSAVRFCQPDGMWNGTLTTCDHESFFCPNPGIPIGGRMVNAHKMRFREGEIVSYECKGNKVLIGSRQRECLKTRAWSGEPPTCQGPYDFEDTLKIASRFGREIEGIVADLQAPIIDQSPKDRRRRFIDPGYTQGMDIYFVFDASGSIPKAHFRYSLDLAKALVSKVGGADGPRRARYGACVFASWAQISFLVSDPQPSVEIVLLLIDGLIDQVNPEEIGQGTATGKALQLVHETMIPAAHDRPNAKKYLFLFTDGKPNVGGYIATARNEAATLRSRYGVEIHCIGIGAEVDRNELQEIASHPISEHLFFIRDYGEVGLLAQSITQQELDYSPCGYNKRPSDRRSPRIVGGEFSESGNWPWQVALFCDPNIAGCDDCVPTFFCGGSLIARKWVLSAAQCFRRCDVGDIRVYTGIIDKSQDSLLEFDPTKVYNLDGDDALIMHEAFNRYLDNDIALLRLSRNVTFSPNVRPICLPQPNMQDTELYSTNGAAYVAGWGSTYPYDTDVDCLDDTYRPTSPVLKELAIPVRTNRECRDSIQDHFRCSIVAAYKPAIAFCAGYSEGNLDACRGDSGGPVMRQLRTADGSRRWVQIGIVSWGEGCAQEGRYGIYTRLSAYKEWIHNHIGAGESPIQIHEHTSAGVDAPESPECNCEVWQECMDTKRDGEWTCRCIHPQHCDDVVGQEQCGSDGRTYASICKLKATACLLDLDIRVASQGPCPESPGLKDYSVYESPESSVDPDFLTTGGQNNESVPTRTASDQVTFDDCGYQENPRHRTWGTIAGGQHSEAGQWPWQVALFCHVNCTRCLPRFFCGGSLIARNWVLSAAHCFRQCKPSDIRVYTGIIDKSMSSLQYFDPALVYTLDGDHALIRHEAFNSDNLDNDIALLRLSCNVKLSSRVRTICMPHLALTGRTLYLPSGEPSMLAGWGTAQPYDYGNLCIDGIKPTSSLLRHVVVPVRTHAECRQSFLHHFQCATVSDYKPDIAFCAGVPEGGSDACKGDSGGPVMRQLTVADGTRRWVQIGIVSWGEGCAVEGRYGIYIRLSAYTDWIQEHVGA